MSGLEIRHIPEPQLEFGFGQKLEYPRDGLYLYGPPSSAAGISEVRYGVLGGRKESGVSRPGPGTWRSSSTFPSGRCDRKRSSHTTCRFPDSSRRSMQGGLPAGGDHRGNQQCRASEGVED